MDIRIVKKELRKKYRNIKSSFSNKEKIMRDRSITKRLLALDVYKNAKVLLCYVSTEIEIDTRAILEDAFAAKKTVAVPACLDKNGKMNFYVIHSLDELQKGLFDLLEPNLQIAKPLLDYKNSLCVLPAFAFDRNGFRIGFGKGFYDRFLQKYDGITAGLCYNECMTNSLPHGKYDVSADYIVTQKYVVSVKTSKEKQK